MILHFSPILMDAALTVAVQGETLILNGLAVDLSALADGDAADSPWIVGPLRRHGQGGVLEVTLLLPIGHDAPEGARFPAPVRVAADGPVALPPRDAAEASAEGQGA
jgi:hypothetical protein